MKVPSVIFLLFNVLGIVLGDVTSDYVGSLIVMLCIYVVMLLFSDGKGKILYFIAIAFGIYGSFMTIYIKSSKNFDCYKGKNVRIVADVESEGVKKKDYYYYEIKTKSVKFKGCRNNIEKKLLLKTDKELNIFRREVYITGEIKIPKEARNFGGFSYKRYLDSRGIEGSVFCRWDAVKIGKKVNENMVLSLGMALRKGILKTIDGLLDKKEASFLKSVLLGNKNYLDDALAIELKDLGLGHMLSVSGINIAYMLLAFRFFLRKSGIRYRFISPVLIIVVGFYVLVVGFTPSIMRAVVMTVLSLMGEFLFYKSRPLSNLAVAALVILLINPFLLYSIGFQFSFAATTCVVLFTDLKILEKRNWKKLESLAISIVLYLGMLPLEMYHFNNIPICSIVVNIILSPLHSMMIFLGTIMTVVGSVSKFLARPFAILLEIIIKFFFIISDNVLGLIFININAVYIGLLGVVIYYSILACIYFYNKYDVARTFFLKYRNVFIIVPTAFIIMGFMYPKKFRVNFIDVGQGDCALIQTTHNKNILIDGGEDIDLSDIIRNNVTKIDIMIATHGHMDHIGGLIKILDNIQVDKLIIPDTKHMGEFCEMKINKNNTRLYRCKVLDSIFIDEYTKIEFLNPNKDEQFDGENDNSLVVKLKHKDINFLFTGDITNVCEKNMIDKGINLKADILKIPHHGSITSTSDEFLDNVNPSVAIISVGEKNKFNHPSSEVLERLKNRNIKVARTDKNGQVQIVIDGRNIKLRTKLTD